jgi:superfamily II DNA or RNA helicase
MGRGAGELLPGLYDVLVTAGLAESIAAVDEHLVEQVGLHRAEASNRIALHLSREIERAVASVPETERVEVGIAVARAMLQKLAELTEVDGLDPEMPTSPGRVLKSITTAQPDGTPRPIDSPLIPLLDTTLLTNAPGEPRVGSQIKTEIGSAQHIDVLMAFIRTSGIRPLVSALERHCAEGGTLRILTTTYTGSTQQDALDLLVSLGAQVRVSYDLTTTRLHAKAWMFQRPSGFSTAYIGSSNLTHSAQIAGREWNVRVSGARNPDVIEKVRAVFETYWESDDFRDYDADEFGTQMAATQRSGPRVMLSPVAITPLPFQERLLEQLALSRERGFHRNLLVAATGTGKTVMAAVDYTRLRRTMGRGRLLFVAHRREILDQSQATFCHAMRDPDFGEQWVAGKRPRTFDHVFASIQTLNAADLSDLPPDYFDVVIIDEFHHAAAESYERLLRHVAPKELLGLTATPERSDGLPILQWFDDRIAAELRLWDAIDQHHLTPFAYYGIHDGMDLRDIPWRRGSGYDPEALASALTSSQSWTEQVIKEFVERVDDLPSTRALGFCVTIEHARHMAEAFNCHGIDAVAIWGDSPPDERRAALRRLADGDVRIVFSVDLFNEGIDVPSVDTLLMLRPTDSPVLFLQQLGRGLRTDEGKTVCTVLDFVGHHRKEFRFDRRFRALLGGTRKEVEHQVAADFPFLPAGCHMELDRKASEIVLASIRSSVPSRWQHKADELRSMIAAGHDPSLTTYLQQTGLELEDVYAGNRGWSDLCESAGLDLLAAGPQELQLRRAVGRLTHVDDVARIEGYLALLSSAARPDVGGLSVLEQRLARMLVSQMVDQIPRDDLAKDASVQEGLDVLWRHPQVRQELVELLRLLETNTTHVVSRLPGRPEVPIQIHARYSRLEILSAFGDGQGARVQAWQTGCRWLPDQRADLFAFTLDKTAGSFSPTTRYKDYAISADLIHWESQTVTRSESATGLRYQQHETMGSDIIMFARLRQDDRAFWCLGPATYVEHEGERPMAIKWRLDTPLPGDLFAQFAAAVA